MITEVNRMPWWSRLALGAIVLAIVAWKAPVMEILSMFFYAVVIPFGVLAAVGLVSSGTIEALGGGWGRFTEMVRTRVEIEREEMARKAARGPTSVPQP